MRDIEDLPIYCPLCHEEVKAREVSAGVRFTCACGYTITFAEDCEESDYDSWCSAP